MILTVALNIFRITLALIFGTPVPKVSKPHLGSISSSNWYDQRVDRVKTWLPTCQFILISGPLPVKRPPRKIFRKIFIAPNDKIFTILFLRHYIKAVIASNHYYQPYSLFLRSKLFEQNRRFLLTTSFLNNLTHSSKTRILAQLDRTAYRPFTLIVNSHVFLGLWILFLNLAKISKVAFRKLLIWK